MIAADSICDWLSQMNVKDPTNRIRLKCLCMFIGNCFNDGWLSNIFRRNITIRVDEPIKVGDTEDDILNILFQLDLTKFYRVKEYCGFSNFHRKPVIKQRI